MNKKSEINFVDNNPLREFLGEADWQKVVSWINEGKWLSEFGDLETRLYEYYSDTMPYGVMKARTGDPEEWFYNKITTIYSGDFPEN